MINITSGALTMLIPAMIATASMMAPPQIDPKQHECLALNIYHEARSESSEGQIAVAQVTLNRVDHRVWPNTICEVVYDDKQFSWTFLVKDHKPHEKKAWAVAKVIARDVMIGNVKDPTYGAVYYHANYVNPYWKKHVTLSKVIGAHLFYTWSEGDTKNAE